MDHICNNLLSEMSELLVFQIYMNLLVEHKIIFWPLFTILKKAQ